MSAADLLRDTLVTGLPYVPLVMGIYLVFRIRDDFDLTIDGSFAMGGAVGATLLLEGLGVPLAMALAILAAGGCGLITAGLHVALRIPVILAGLVVAIGLFSVNLHILGVPSQGLNAAPTLFSGFSDMSSDERDLWTIAVLAGVSVATLVAIGLFLRSEIGLALRVSGVNGLLARSQGVNEGALLALSLFAANALAGLSGVLVVQAQSFADVNMGTGILLAGIGAFLLGELVTRPTGSTIVRALLAVFLGALLYRFVLVLALELGLAPTDLKLATSLTLIAAFVLKRGADGAIEWRGRRTQLATLLGGRDARAGAR